MTKMRISMIVFSVFLALAGALPAAATAPAPRARVVVDDAMLRLGDVFENLDAQADTIIGESPRPGLSVVRDATWLGALARAYALPWQAARDDRVVIERASRMLAREEIEAILRPALSKRHIAADWAIDLDGRSRQVYVARSDRAPLTLTDLQLDTRGRFVAQLAAGGNKAGSGETIALGGRVAPTQSVPVPARRIAPGEIIAENDIEWQPLKLESLRRNALTDLERIVGMAARQPLESGQPILSHQVQVPIVVAKGEIVSIKLESPNLAITAQGRALESGGDGAVIRVLNTQSKRTIEARVLGPSMVGVDVHCCTLSN